MKRIIAMYCSNCGHKLDNHALFCSNCGSQVNLNLSESNSERPSVQRTMEPPISKYEAEKIYVLVSHLGGFFLSLLAPLVVYLLKKDEKPTNNWVMENAANSLNFQATFFSLFLGIFIFDWVLLKFIESNMTIFNYRTLSGIVSFIGFISGLVMLILVAFDLVQCVIAASKAVSGNIYSYPYAYDFINKFRKTFGTQNNSTYRESENTQSSKLTQQSKQLNEIEDGYPHCGGWNPDESTICQYCKKPI